MTAFIAVRIFVLERSLIMAKNKKQFLVLGLGRFGQSVAQTLHGKGYEVMAVDGDIDKVNEALEFCTRAVKADLHEETALESIGAGEFDVAVVAVGKDTEASIMSTMILKELGVKNVIVKANTEIQKKALYKIGADKVVFPERDMGRRVALSLIHDNVFDFMELSDDISIAEIPVLDQWAGKTLIENDIRRNHDINIIAIKNGDDITVSYGGDRILSSDDVLVVIGTVSAISKVASK